MRIRSCIILWMLQGTVLEENSFATLRLTMSGMPLVPAVTLGAVSGMRAMMAPAVISWSARKSGLDLHGGPFSAFKGAGIMKAATALMMGEVVADKMPFMPDRTDPMALATRALSGGAAGMAAFKARRRSVVVGAVIGAAAA